MSYLHYREILQQLQFVTSTPLFTLLALHQHWREVWHHLPPFWKCWRCLGSPGLNESSSFWAALTQGAVMVHWQNSVSAKQQCLIVRRMKPRKELCVFVKTCNFQHLVAAQRLLLHGARGVLKTVQSRKGGKYQL